MIKSLGAKIVPVSREQGGFLGSIRMTEELARREQNVFLPAQFANLANVEAHEQTTGPELWWQLHSQSIKPDAFVAGVGTGGTVMGVGNFLRQHDALLAEELGFGMWRAREDVADAEGYVSDLRESEMRTSDVREKTPEEFLLQVHKRD